MNRSRSRFLARALFALFLVVSACWIVLAGLNGEPLLGNLMFSVLYASFGIIGLLIASRRPENSLGWIFLAIAIGANAGNGANSYAEYALVTSPGSLPAGAWMAVLGETLWPTAITCILLLLVLFPSGRPSSRFQRWLLWSAIAGIVGLSLGGFLLKPGRIAIADGVSVANPAGIDWLRPVLAVLDFGGVVVSVTACLAVGALIVQTRRAQGVERQQLKWFGYSALALIVVNFGIGNLLETIFPAVTGVIGNLMFVMGFAFIPIGTGVAILKYRLYDLERIVNRTLVYGGLTAVLAGAYLGLVVLLQALMEPVTRESDLAVAGSTLAVAAMFRPLRTRLQAFIDHRFYRRKYDAQATLEAFVIRLRNEIELSSLTQDLVTTVTGAMQPSHASVWLRPDARAAREGSAS